LIARIGAMDLKLLADPAPAFKCEPIPLSLSSVHAVRR
jgi:hypothetical protein